MNPRRGPAACLASALLAAAFGCGEVEAPASRSAPLDGIPGRVADAVARAKSLESGGELRASEAAWEEVLALRPGHASALYATARLRRRRGDLPGSLRRIDALHLAEPNAGRGWLLAAEILADPGSGAVRDLAGAEAAARAALDRNPEESGPHLVLGRVILLAGRPEEAAERLAVAARMNPRDAESRSLLGTVWLRRGRSDAARRWFREAIRCASGPGVGAGHAGLPGEGDTAPALAAGRAPSAGELRAAAGLAAMGDEVGGARAGRTLPEELRARALDALQERATGEAILDRGGDGVPFAAVVQGSDGPAVAVLESAGAVALYR